MLDADVKAQLKAYLERLVQPIELVANVDDSEGSRDMMDLLRDVAEQSLGGLAEALRGADFSALKETNDYVREQEREAERSAEKEREIGIDRERGHSL